MQITGRGACAVKQSPCCTPWSHEQGRVASKLRACRLERIVDGRGHTGEAKPTDSTARRSAAHGTPGFERQHDIYECSVCAHAINDGSTRILGGDAGAPRGEFRYSCQQCASFHLCEGCYDRCAAWTVLWWSWCGRVSP